MLMKVLALVLLALLSVGCDQEPTREYHEPTYSGMVYMTTNSSHLVVLNLADQQVSRIVADKSIRAIHLMAAEPRLLLFSADGWVQAINLTTGDFGEWLRICDQIEAVCGYENAVYVLNRLQNEVYRFDATQWQIRTTTEVDPAISSVQLSDDGANLWLLAGETGEIELRDAQTMVHRKAIRGAGNSIHQLLNRPEFNEIWVAEGNEFKDGKPYGVGFAKAQAVPGGLNILDGNGTRKDFIYVGGNVMDLAVSEEATSILAVSQMPVHEEASLVVLDNANMRVVKEYRLCQACHYSKSIDFPDDRAMVGSMQVDWQGRGFSKATTAGGGRK